MKVSIDEVKYYINRAGWYERVVADGVLVVPFGNIRVGTESAIKAFMMNNALFERLEILNGDMVYTLCRVMAGYLGKAPEISTATFRRGDVRLGNYRWECLGEDGVGLLLGLRVRPEVVIKVIKEGKDLNFPRKVYVKTEATIYSLTVTPRLWNLGDAVPELIGKFPVAFLHLPNHKILDVAPVDKELIEPIGMFLEVDEGVENKKCFFLSNPFTG